jgi:hypothetical protein
MEHFFYMNSPKWEMKGKSIQKTNFILETPKDINDFVGISGSYSFEHRE